MTFDTNGEDQSLTWARDDASVMGAIMGARTGSNLEDSSIRTDSEILGRGSSPMCVVDLDGYILSNGKTVINRARGYVAGRYLEITNEVVGTLDPKAGVGLITLNAWSYPDEDPVTIPGRPYVGQDGYKPSINDVKRQPNERTNSGIYASILVYYAPVTGASSPLSITPRDSVAVTANVFDTNNPYAFNPTPQGWRWSSDVIAPSGERVARNGDNLPGQVATYITGDKDTGWWGMVRSDLSRYVFQEPAVGYTPYHENRDMTDSVPAILAYGDISAMSEDNTYRNYKANLDTVVGSRLFGLISRDAVDNNYNPTLSDWYGLASYVYANRNTRSLDRPRSEYNVYQHPLSLSGASITVTNPGAGSGLRGFNNKARWLSGSSASSWPTTVASGGSLTMSGLMADLHVDDVFVSVSNVEYITGTELDRLKSHNYVPTYNNKPRPFFDTYNEKCYAKVTLSARIPYATYQLTLGAGDNSHRAYGSDFPTGDAIYAFDVVYVVPLWSFTHLIKKGNSYQSDINIGNADDFRRAVQEVGSDEKTVLTRLITPLVGTQMLFNHWLLNRDDWMTHFLAEYDKALKSGNMYTAECAHIMPGIVQDAHPAT
nr:MAG TPA: hypothetical protein [Caudoviricetes sp.]